jgi:hypothetical protein
MTKLITTLASLLQVIRYIQNFRCSIHNLHCSRCIPAGSMQTLRYVAAAYSVCFFIFAGMTKGALGLITLPATAILDFGSYNLKGVRQLVMSDFSVEKLRPARYIPLDGFIVPFRFHESEGFQILQVSILQHSLVVSIEKISGMNRFAEQLAHGLLLLSMSIVYAELRAISRLLVLPANIPR